MSFGKGMQMNMQFAHLFHCDSHRNIKCDWTRNDFSPLVCRRVWKAFDKNPQFVNEEQPTALLNNASKGTSIIWLSKVSHFSK